MEYYKKPIIINGCYQDRKNNFHCNNKRNMINLLSSIKINTNLLRYNHIYQILFNYGNNYNEFNFDVLPISLINGYDDNNYDWSYIISMYIEEIKEGYINKITLLNDIDYIFYMENM